MKTTLAGGKCAFRSVLAVMAALLITGCGKKHEDVLAAPGAPSPMTIQLLEPVTQDVQLTLGVFAVAGDGQNLKSEGQGLPSLPLEALKEGDVKLEPSTLVVPRGKDSADFILTASKAVAGRNLVVIIFTPDYKAGGFISVVVREDPGANATPKPSTPTTTPAPKDPDPKGPPSVKTPIGGKKR